MTPEWWIRWNWLLRGGVYFSWLLWIVWLIPNRGLYDYWNAPVGPDHVAFYSAARVIHDREVGAEQIYQWHDYIRPLQKRIIPEHWDTMVAFRNPPFYALLYHPLAGYSYWTSAYFWQAISMLALVLALVWLELPSLRRAWIMAMGFFPVLATLMYGQNSLLSLAIFSLTYRLLKRDRPYAAGLVAGFLIYKPTLITGLILWGLLDFRRKWPCAIGMLMTSVLLCCSSYLLIPRAWEGFIETLPENLRFDETCLEWWKNVVPEAFWVQLLPGVNPRWIRILTVGCQLLGLLGFLRIWWTCRDNLPVMFGAVIALTLWTSSHSLVYEWTLLLIPGFLWWYHSGVEQKSWVMPYVVTSIGLFMTVDFSWVQIWIKRGFSPDPPDFSLMVGIPALAWSGWKAIRLLTRPL